MTPDPQMTQMDTDKNERKGLRPEGPRYHPSWAGLRNRGPLAFTDRSPWISGFLKISFPCAVEGPRWGKVMRGDEFFQEISRRPPFTKLHPRVAGFFKSYFANEKAVAFGGQHVINTHFPPFPSPAFDQLARQFAELGDASTRRLYSVTVAVTNRCPFGCWHCYTSGRSQQDVPLEVLRGLAGQLQDLGAVMVTLTGGEPLLREDLAEIVGAFDSRSCLILGTTGEGLTHELARALRERGLFAIGISLDSDVEASHDRLRGRPGAFRDALRALDIAGEQGL